MKTKTYSRRNILGTAAKLSVAVAASAAVSSPLVKAAHATIKRVKTYRFAWSHYTGWEIWGYIQASGIMNKWAKKHGVKIEVERINDYIESINEYTSGVYDGCAMTTMDAIMTPCVKGVDSTALIIGDYSNGNDGIISREANSIAELAGKEVGFIEFSVSHYLLARALSKAGLRERDIRVMPVASENDIPGLFIGKQMNTTVTWNPLLMKIRQRSPEAKLLFSSAEIPTEILDVMLVRSDLPDSVKMALTGAWYEAMQLMSDRARNQNLIKELAYEAGGTEAEFLAQLKTTAMYYDANEINTLVQSPELSAGVDYVRQFLFDHGLFNGNSKDFVGIQMADGSILGDKNRIKLRFATPIQDV